MSPALEARQAVRRIPRPTRAAFLVLLAACAAAAPSALPSPTPAIRPLAVVHRGGGDVTFPENTLEALDRALDAGALAVEVDVAFTRDGRLPLWHDGDPRTAGAALRRLGAEAGAFRPLVPVRARRPVTELEWAQARLELGYARADGARAPFRVPLLEEALARMRARPGFRLVVLDLKAAAPVALGERFPAALAEVLTASGLGSEQVLLLHRDPEVVRHLQRALAGRWPLALDVGGPGLWHCPGSALALARSLGTPVVSLARPALGVGAWEAFLATARADRAGIEAEVRGGHPRRRLLVWTLDDEAELRAAVEVGVDLIVTDRPERLEALLDAQGR